MSVLVLFQTKSIIAVGTKNWWIVSVDVVYRMEASAHCMQILCVFIRMRSQQQYWIKSNAFGVEWDRLKRNASATVVFSVQSCTHMVKWKWNWKLKRHICSPRCIHGRTFSFFFHALDYFRGLSINCWFDVEHFLVSNTRFVLIVPKITINIGKYDRKWNLCAVKKTVWNWKKKSDRRFFCLVSRLIRTFWTTLSIGC